jgi:hypothetical protein
MNGAESVGNSSPSQEIARILWTPKGYYWFRMAEYLP